MKKITIILMMAIIMVSSVFGASEYGVSGSDTILYYPGVAIGTQYNKAYMAIDQIVPAGCSINSINCIVTIFGTGGPGNFDCSEKSVWYSLVGTNEIRVVMTNDDPTQTLPMTVSLTLTGSGSCTLSSADYVLSYQQSTNPPVLGAITMLPKAVGASNVLSFCTPLTDADIDCSNSITWSELNAYITAWALQNTDYGYQISWSNLDSVITSWASQV